MINIDDFRKVELKIGKILEAERVPESEKLIKLKVDLGAENLSETKQLLAGIGLAYSPENLIGKEVVVVANLEPRMIMGVESQGMLLAANDGGPIILTPEREVAPGSKVS